MVLDSPLHATVSFFAFSLLKLEKAKDPGRGIAAAGSDEHMGYTVLARPVRYAHAPARVRCHAKFIGNMVKP